VSSSNTSRGGGIDVPTLLITAAASAGAAYVCSQVWAPGTLASAAFTPVLVAVLKEALARPTEVVVRAVPVRGVVRSATREGAQQPAAPPPPEVERVAQQGELQGLSHAGPRRAWRAAIATGLLGFLLAAVVVTVPELVAGKAASGGDRGTTLFGGQERSRSESEQTPTQTTTSPTETLTVPKAETVTVPPAETTTLPPATTPVPPAETTPEPPGTTTPVPPPTTTPAP
jgi:hypothetical protein